MSTTERRQKVVRSHPGLSLVEQCDLLGIHRSGLYYKPKNESPLNLTLMRKIDACFLEHPYYGVERMTDYLNLDLGYCINVKRIRRLYRLMGLQTIYKKPRTTVRDLQSYKYPYLLKGLKIERPNQVWQTDITYIPMSRGFMYMNAIIDVHSRKIPLLNTGHQRFIIPIKGLSIPVTNTSTFSKNITSRFLWMAREGPWTIFTSNVFGSP
ncbi:IS3 family transposase [Arenibacter sp. 6A1]|uniref:IS3 family transposase n=1 Tax=Arenibacter sp. 6A1 TaxID=2720391 RepID=UPI0014462DB7|nr:IS3 family transposase [Arenibacter sp. 6A1]NKI26564.1 IS3 family transposase [Arenibacter sp. 6A1]